ncbi:MAG: hypothetical protein SPH70_00285 [Candidatus Cryptobacteroides sp.]|nr:hypothetical protein [Bacteroidales bacterium]MDY6157511.1 hypothetical protein [Candidatus Cryptobacteroides sp.]
MADNYLEKRSEELSRGKTVIRKSNPSLDSLLKSLGTNVYDPSYVVKQAQLDALVRSASLLGADATFRTDEASATISLECPDPLTAGECLLALRLKAAELKLGSRIDSLCDKDGKFSAVLSLFR